MALPKAVEEAEKRAQDIHNEVYGVNPEGNEPPKKDEPEKPSDAPPQEPGNPEPPKDVPPVEPPPAPGALAVEDEDWKQRFATLQGKYNAEVPRLASEIARLTADRKRLEEENTELKRAQVQAQAQPLVSRPSTEAMKKLEEELGIEVTGTLNAIIAAEVEERLKETIKPVQTKMANFEQTQVKTAEDGFFDHLDRSMPDWAVTNKDPQFLSWLERRVPGYGSTYKSLLDSAHSRLDGQAALEIFEMFKRDSAMPAPSAQPGVNTPPKNDRQKELERMIAPGRSGAGQQPPTNNNKKTYSRADINRYYQDVTNGKWAGREDEAKRLETDFFLAQQEGRVTA